MKPGDRVKAVVIINRLWWLFEGTYLIFHQISREVQKNIFSVRNVRFKALFNAKFKRFRYNSLCCCGPIPVDQSRYFILGLQFFCYFDI